MAKRNALAPKINNSLYRFNVTGNPYPYEGDLIADTFKPTGRYIDTSGVKEINLSDYGRAFGVYDTENPGVITLSPTSLQNVRGDKTGPTPAEVYAHEHQHLLNWKRSSGQSISLPGNPINRLPSARINPTATAINKIYDKYRYSHGLSADFKSTGLYAELRRLESRLPVGKNIFDTPIGKDLVSKIPEIKSFYYQATTPIDGTEMHSAGLPGETIVPTNKSPSTLEAIQNWIRNKTAY